jgi:hypothetical protein
LYARAASVMMIQQLNTYGPRAIVDRAFRYSNWISLVRAREVLRSRGLEKLNARVERDRRSLCDIIASLALRR